MRRHTGKIKVANIIEEGRLGGPQVRMVEVSRCLKQLPVDNTVICPFLQSGRFRKRLLVNQIPHIQMPLHKLTKNRRQLCSYVFSFMSELFLLLRYFYKQQFDVVHVSGGCWQFKGVIAGKLAGSRVIWHLNDTQAPRLFRVFVKIMCRLFVDGLIVAGEKVKQYYVTEMNIQNMPVFEIQAPVDTRYYNPFQGRKNSGKTPLSEGLNVVTIGNINPKKGYENFISMTSLLKDFKTIHFYIIGPCFDTQKAYFRKLKKLRTALQAANLTFFGHSDQIRDILGRTAIYVCSSLTEASPMAVREAMSMGIPVITTDVGDVSRLIQDGENGYIVPCQSPEKMAQKVRLLAENGCLRKTLGRKARCTVLEKVNSDTIARQHFFAYAHIVGQRKSTSDH
jgi:glycosyltransferase involved in cell wall biosynthesis